MSRIFLSHNSADNEITEHISQRLQAAGHRCVFVDYDPRLGIAAGKNWEQQLYRELRACHVMIILCSESSMASHWCFAEVTHAKSLGKPVIPVLVGPCEVHPILRFQQYIDWTAQADEEVAWKRLERGLLEAGLEAGGSFDWDGTRKPFPGLLSFEADDAPVFFGRDREILEGREKLNRQQQLGGCRSLLVLGPSGSGKSSLVRAGILPRMRTNARQWLVLDEIRPRGRPMQELAWALGQALADTESTISAGEIEARLEDADPGELREILNQVLVATGQRDASVILTIDQAEELVSDQFVADGPESRFIQLILGALNMDLCPLHVVWTLRSDFLATFQQHPLLRELDYDDLSLGLMDAGDLAQVIEGPAALSGIELESGLVQRILADVQGEDALPLLAFTMHELYETFQEDGRLTIQEYDDLGGLIGSIARAAEHVYQSARMTDDEEQAFQRACLSLVRITESGAYARRIVDLSSLSPSIRKVVDRFVQARLFVAGSDGDHETLEVAHEALFRSWQRLSRWLLEDQEFLQWIRRLEFAFEEWSRSKDTGTLLRGKDLLDADFHLRQHPDWSPGKEQSLFIEKSRRRRTRNRLLSGLTIGGIMLVLAGATWYSTEQAREAERMGRLAISGQLTIEAALAEDSQLPGDSLLLAIQSLQAVQANGEPVPEAENSVYKAIKAWENILGELSSLMWPFYVEILDYSDEESVLFTTAFSADGSKLVTGGALEAAQITGTRAGFDSVLARLTMNENSRFLEEQGIAYQLAHYGTIQKSSVLTAAFSPNDDWLAIGGAGGRLYLSKPEQEYKTPVFLSDASVATTSVSFDSQNSRIAWGTDRGQIWTTSLAQPGENLELIGELTDTVSSVSFSADGKWIATTGPNNPVQVWPVDSGDGSSQARNMDLEGAHVVEFSADGRWLAAGGSDGIRVWDANDLENNVPFFEEFPGTITAISLSRSGQWLATGGNDGSIYLWDLEQTASEPRLLFGHDRLISSLDFDAGDQWLASSSYDGQARLWPLEPDRLIVSACQVLAAIVDQEVFRETRSLNSRRNLQGHDLLAEACHEPILSYGQDQARLASIFGEDSLDKAVSALQMAASLSADEQADGQAYTRQLGDAKNLMRQAALHAASVLVNAGVPDEAEDVLDNAIELDPEMDLIPGTAVQDDDPGDAVEALIANGQ